MAEQARWGDGWVKLVGDWIDRDIGRPGAAVVRRDPQTRRIDAAHDNGARVTAHVFSEDALPGLINAGIDCIEHGTGLTDDTIELMVAARHRAGADADQHRELPRHRRRGGEVSELRTAHEGPLRDVLSADRRRARSRHTDLRGHRRGQQGRTRGRIADEIEALKGIGMSPTEALGAASWTARASGWDDPVWSTGLRPISSATPTTRARAPR